jgi:hypothetical protein
MAKAYLVVEGHGEVEAARNLVIRLWADLGPRREGVALSKHFPRGKAYKPTLDQLKLTQWIDFGVLRTSGARSFRTLENALRFLAAPAALKVYPPPRP